MNISAADIKSRGAPNWIWHFANSVHKTWLELQALNYAKHGVDFFQGIVGQSIERFYKYGHLSLG